MLIISKLKTTNDFIFIHKYMSFFINFEQNQCECLTQFMLSHLICKSTLIKTSAKKKSIYYSKKNFISELFLFVKQLLQLIIFFFLMAICSK
jgi:hypothetical protein